LISIFSFDPHPTLVTGCSSSEKERGEKIKNSIIPLSSEERGQG
jgi:hypothetical protein